LIARKPDWQPAARRGQAPAARFLRGSRPFRDRRALARFSEGGTGDPIREDAMEHSRSPSKPCRAPRVVLLALALVTAGAGCATGRRVAPAWPPPPARERIRFVRTLAGGDDVETGLARFWRILARLDAPARLYHPLGVAVSPEGDLVAVTDQGLVQVLVFDLAAGRMRVISRDVLGEAPGGVAIAAGEIWVTVPARKVALAWSREGRPLRAIELADCERPLGIAVDAERRLLYVTDASSPQGEGHSVHVHALDDGAHRARWGKRGHGEGELFFPTFLALRPGGGVFVADTMNARVVELDEAGAVVRQIGERGDRFGQFDKPKGVALDSFGNLYVVDSFFAAVQIFSREGRLLLFFGTPGDTPGFLANPAGIAIDGHNRIYVANGLNYRVDVYELVNTTAADSRADAGGPAPELAAAPPHPAAPRRSP
jgi:DNA-binding beta-propeller fold protein YncE